MYVKTLEWYIYVQHTLLFLYICDSTLFVLISHHQHNLNIEEEKKYTDVSTSQRTILVGRISTN